MSVATESPPPTHSAGYLSLLFYISDCRSRMKSSRPKRDSKSTQKTEYFYGFPPATERQRKQIQKKKTKAMQDMPETIHWDMHHTNQNGSGDEAPCDAQFVTPRIQAWKDLFKQVYPTAQWNSISHGVQMKIPNEIIVSMYDSGKVLVQGPRFKQWVDDKFEDLKDSLDQTSIKCLSRPIHNGDDATTADSDQTRAKTVDDTMMSQVDIAEEARPADEHDLDVSLETDTDAVSPSPMRRLVNSFHGCSIETKARMTVRNLAHQHHVQH